MVFIFVIISIMLGELALGVYCYLSLIYAKLGSCVAIQLKVLLKSHSK